MLNPEIQQTQTIVGPIPVEISPIRRRHEPFYPRPIPGLNGYPSNVIDISSHRPLSEIEARNLSAQEISVLSLIGRGFTPDEAIDKLDSPFDEIEASIYSTMLKLDAKSLSQVVARAIQNGDLKSGVLVPYNFDKTILNQLDLEEKDILAGIASGISLGAVAQNLQMPEHYVKDRRDSSALKIGAKTPAQAIVFYLEVERRREGIRTLNAEKKVLSEREHRIIMLSGKGFNRYEIARELGISHGTLKNINSTIIPKLGAQNILHAIVRSVNIGEIDLEEMLPEGFDPSILKSLSAREREVVQELIKNEGGLSGREVASSLGIVEDTLKTHMNTILSKTGAKNRRQLTVFYLYAKKMAQERLGNIPLTQLDIFGSLPDSAEEEIEEDLAS
jgi:DNA-binding NarL/FixJ family response regulator